MEAPIVTPVPDAQAIKKALDREKKREYMRKYRAANPSKAKADAAAWYMANQERINEPKRRAAFEANEQRREKAAAFYGEEFKPRVYEVFTTNDPRTFRCNPNPVTPCARW